MRMRSPSSAPPLRRRVGSTASTAMRICGKCVQEAQQQFVHDAGLAGTAGAGDADYRRLARRRAATPCAGARARLRRAARSSIDRQASRRSRSRRRATTFAGPLRSRAGARCARAHDVFDHRDETQVHAVVRVVDALDAVGLQLGDFFRRDRAAAAAEHADVRRAALASACRPCT